MRRQCAGWIMFRTLSLLWGGSFLFVELASTGLPPTNVVRGWVILAERLGAKHLAGLGLILAGLGLIERQRGVANVRK